MSTSTISWTVAWKNIELIPSNFGLWSGPGWSGGRIIPPGGDTTGDFFIQLYFGANKR